MKTFCLKFLTLFLLFFCFQNLFAQKILDKKRNEIKQKVYLIDKQNKQDIDSSNFIWKNSVEVNSKLFPNKLVANNTFQNESNKSKKLEIKYYFENNKLFYIKIEEQSPTLTDLKKHTEFFVTNDKIVDYGIYFNVRICLAVDMNKSMSEQYGYNPNFDEKFLRKYSIQLLEKIKNYR